MKHLKLFEETWEGPPPEWENETVEDQEASNAIEAFGSLKDFPYFRSDVDSAAYTYSDMGTIEESITKYFNTNEFFYLPLDSTTTTNKYVLRMFEFRDMVENSEDMKYTEDADNQSWEWNGIKGVDYSIEGHVNGDDYHVTGTAIPYDDYNFLAQLPIEILKNEESTKLALQNKDDIDVIKSFFTK